MKAIVLAAGLGTRLRPVTNWLPKPLIPVFDVPIIVHVIEQLRQNGVEDIWINLHHMPWRIIQFLRDGSHLGVDIHYSLEPTLLGTAGGIRKIASSFGNETFLVVNGDTYRPIDLQRLLQYHRNGNALVTLLLQKDETLGPETAVSINGGGEVVGFLDLFGDHNGAMPCHFLGVQVMEADVISFIPPNRFWELKEVYLSLHKTGKVIRGYCQEGYWLDIGTLAAYRKIHFDALSKRSPLAVPAQEVESGIWVGEGARIHENVAMEGPVFVGAGAEVRSGARLGPNAVIGRGCLAGEGAVIEDSILWEGVTLGRGSKAKGELVTKEFRCPLII